MAHARVTWLLLALALGACEGSGTLVVQVRTDLAPEVEFAQVTTILTPAGGGAPQETTTPIGDASAWGSGVRVAEVAGLARGELRLRVRAERADGSVVVERPVRVTLDEALETVTVLLTRSCEGVECPAADGDPTAAACLGGRCVDERCVEEDSPECGTPECTSDVECAAGVACAVPRCEASGTCFAEPDHGLCGEGAVCGPTGCQPIEESGCEPLPEPTGAIVSVRPGDDLAAIVAAAAPDDTILLEDGVYGGTGALVVAQPGITIRGASGDPAAVILDAEYRVSEMIYVRASRVTLAHLTLAHATAHHVRVSPAGPIAGLRFHEVHFVDAAQTSLRVSSDPATGAYADAGRVECSRFELTDAGRAMALALNGGECFTGGVHLEATLGWLVTQSTFVGFHCGDAGLGAHAVQAVRGARGTGVERTLFRNCARAIAFGLGETMVDRVYADDPYPGIAPIAHFDGLVRNNVVYTDDGYFDTGISLWYAHGARVLHNTFVTVGDPAFASIDARYATTNPILANNLLADGVVERDGASPMLITNGTLATLDHLGGATSGDFHLTADALEALDQGTVIIDSGLDIDGQPHDRGAAPDIGADER